MCDHEARGRRSRGSVDDPSHFPRAGRGREAHLGSLATLHRHGTPAGFFNLVRQVCGGIPPLGPFLRTTEKPATRSAMIERPRVLYPTTEAPLTAAFTASAD